MPDAQILDIRNAISYLQGEPGIDRARIGVWGTDMRADTLIAMPRPMRRVKAAVRRCRSSTARDVRGRR